MIASPSPTLYPQASTSRNVWSRSNHPSSGSSVTAAARSPGTAAQASRRSSTSTSSSTTDMRSSYARPSPRLASAVPVSYSSRDASTQYSSPESPASQRPSQRGKRKADTEEKATMQQNMSEEDEPPRPRLTPKTHATNAGKSTAVATTVVTSDSATTNVNAAEPVAKPAQAQAPSQPEPEPQPSTAQESTSSTSPSKRPRPLDPAATIVPVNYEDCPTSDLVPIIASMLMDLIRHNDDMPVTNTGLTRFHSRAPPGISVQDYLQRLAHHATLSPPILLCMVYYIDRLCAIWPKFTINSLTVHRYLIASATVASKGLSDSFWTNATYARVGGVSLKELALLELEFLWRIEWRIVPKPEVLVDYYKSLVQRSQGYEIEGQEEIPAGEDASGKEEADAENMELDK